MLSGCLAASKLAPPWSLLYSLSLSLAYISLLCKSHMYIGYFLLPVYIHSFFLRLLLKDISVFPACSVSQLASVSDHWVLSATTPWAVRLRNVVTPGAQPPRHCKAPILLPTVLMHYCSWAAPRISYLYVCLYFTCSDISLWSLASVLQGFRCLLHIDNIVIKKLALELGNGPLLLT